MEIPPVFETTLAKDLPAGPFPGQHFHPAGSSFTASTRVDSTKIGSVVFMAPDPVFFYLKIAHEALQQLDPLRKAIKDTGRSTLLKGEILISAKTEHVYDYITQAIQFITHSFTAIEAFINQHVPNLTEYKIREDNKVKTRKDRTEVERYVRINDKITFVCEHKGLGNPRKQPYWDAYMELKRIRDELIHLKTKGESSFQRYEDIYKDLLDANFEDLFKQTKALLSHIDPDISKHLQDD